MRYTISSYFFLGLLSSLMILQTSCSTEGKEVAVKQKIAIIMKLSLTKDTLNSFIATDGKKTSGIIFFNNPVLSALGLVKGYSPFLIQ